MEPIARPWYMDKLKINEHMGHSLKCYEEDVRPGTYQQAHDEARKSGVIALFVILKYVG